VEPDLSHLCTAAVEQAGLDSLARIQLVRQRLWIPTRHTTRIHRRLEYLRSHPKTTSMPNMLVVGVSGSGKTTLIEEFLSHHPRVEDEEHECACIPVVFCNAPPEPDLGGLYNSILVAMGLPAENKRIDIRRYHVEQVLAMVKAELFIMDEIQQFLLAGQKMQRILLTALKSLSNTLNLSIVAVGTREALSLFGDIDPQIARRFEKDEIPKMSCNREFARLLRTLESLTPLRRRSNLTEEAIARQLHEMSRGTIGRLSRTVSEAAVIAIEDGEERITPEILKKVMTASIYGTEDPAA
jgi:DNA polymerase III delta prime subunit